MKHPLALVSFLLLTSATYSQVYIQQGKTPATTALTIKYRGGDDGVRPGMEIEFRDGFSLFEEVLPVCPGEYAWCLRNAENTDIAYLKIDFVGKQMTTKVKIDRALSSDPDRDEIRKHLEMLNASFVRIP